MSNGTAVLEEVTQTPAVNSTITSAPQEAAGDLPLWVRQQREQGWREFSTMPNPTRKDQAWRFSNVGALDLSPYRFGNAPSEDRKSTRLNSSHMSISYAVFCLKKKKIVGQAFAAVSLVQFVAEHRADCAVHVADLFFF